METENRRRHRRGTAGASIAGARVDYVFTNTGSAEGRLLQRPFSSAWCGSHLTPDGTPGPVSGGWLWQDRDKPAFVNVHLAAGTRQGSGQLQNAFFDGTPMVVTAAMRDTGSFADHVTLARAVAFLRWASWKTLLSAAGKCGMPACSNRHTARFPGSHDAAHRSGLRRLHQSGLDTRAWKPPIQPGADRSWDGFRMRGVLRTIFDALLNAENPLLVCGSTFATLTLSARLSS